MSIQNTAGGVAAIITERLGRIRTADGYESDIGRRIFRGRRKVHDEQVDTGCVSVIEGVDKPTDRVGGRLAETMLEQHYGLVAYVPLLADEEPNDAAHRALRDMKRAIFDKDATFNQQVKEVKYIGRDIGAREDGVQIVLAVLEIAVVYVETLITP